MSRQDYAREKFSLAIDVLATSASSIQDRLYFAYMSFHPVQASDFEEEEDAALYRKIMEAITQVKDGPESEGYVRNTLNRMSDSECEHVADDILELHYRLEHTSRR